NIAHEGVYEHAWVPKRQEYDFAPLYAQVKERISAYDVAVVNQETILVADPALRGGFPLFGTPLAMGDALADSGFDVVLGATNHALDRGQTGIDDTLAFWRGKHPEVTVLGLHEDAQDAVAIDYVEANGIRLALFNATEGLNGRVPEAGFEYEIDTLDDLDGLVKRVQEAETQADATACFLHIGEEYASKPTVRQREVVERLVDAGADAVICSHSHIVQPMEELRTQAGNTAVVYWSLGNFVSNQMDPRTVLGAAASLRFERQPDGTVLLARHEAIPLVCHFDEQSTYACFLDDYTEADAAAHYLNQDEPAFTLEALRQQWHATMG
ncbi:MAG: CapA family protein, partial [Coriobacteriia bacterium]|nr:CapA family protein [Coriobacteriia bacterium]